jgi:hypothetical protein
MSTDTVRVALLRVEELLPRRIRALAAVATLALAVVPPDALHALPCGCWLSRRSISASMREPAPIGPGG